MGGLPCYKVVINRRLEAELLGLMSESQATTDLLAAKAYFESPVLKQLISYEEEMIAQLKIMKRKFRELNDAYVAEADGDDKS